MADHEARPQEEFILVPERRKGREVWAAVTLVPVVSLIHMILFVISPGQEAEACYAEETRCKQTNTNDRRCNKPCKVNYTFWLFKLALVYLSAVIGVIADRLCLIFEEKHHLVKRYDGSWSKMLKSCFSGIRWSIVGIAATAAAVSLIAEMRPAKEDITATILSGLLIVPLAFRLFNSNIKSQVEVSRILEDNEKSVANGLAWSFYFGYLEIILPGLKDRIQGRNWNFRLSSDKLFILLPLDCNIRKDINDADHRITKEDDGDLEYVVKRAGLDRKYTNKVYRIDFEGQRYHLLLEYATTLDTLKKMSEAERIRALEEEERIDQVKLFCQTLQGRILENPLNVECQGKCDLVIYDSKMLEDQGNGLAGLLVERIEDVGGAVGGQQRQQQQPQQQQHAQENEGPRDVHEQMVPQEHGELVYGLQEEGDFIDPM